MKIAIHQPNFFPWLGYFSKIKQSDRFIFLDHSINNRKDASYIRRTSLVSKQGKPFYVSVPVSKINGSDFGPINKWSVNTKQPKFPKNILKQIEQEYGKTPNFNIGFELIQQYYNRFTKNSNLSDNNIHFISTICKQLEIEKKFVRSSDFPNEDKSTKLLISLVKHCGGTKYISGKGGDKYQDKIEFDRNGIKLDYSHFKIQNYQQQHNSNEFVKGLSIIDAIMNISFDEINSII